MPTRTWSLFFSLPIFWAGCGGKSEHNLQEGDRVIPQLFLAPSWPKGGQGHLSVRLKVERGKPPETFFLPITEVPEDSFPRTWLIFHLQDGREISLEKPMLPDC